MKAIQPAVAELKVVYKNKQAAAERLTLSSSADAHRLLLSGFNPDTIALCEEFVAVYLNRANQVLGLYKVGVGGVTGVVADPRLVFAVALRIAAVSLIVSHNHPSGSMKPSRQDEELTSKLREAGKFFDVKLLDHLIISPCGERYFSFADQGLL